MVDIIITGFGEFGGVKDNPTTHLINHFHQNGIPGIGKEQIRALKVLHVSVETGGQQLKELQEACKGSSNIQLWIHLGVSAKATTFCLEQRAQNCLDFPEYADECGKKACNEPIVDNDSIGARYCSSLPLGDIHQILEENKGFGDICQVSQDAGKFICNYVYFKSLEFCRQGDNRFGMFLHVPLFSVIPMERQVEFISSLLQILVDECGKPNPFPARIQAKRSVWDGLE